MQYILMNKDHPVALFSVQQSPMDEDVSFTMHEQYGKLPFGFQNMNQWINGRKASSHNKELKEIMIKYGCDDNLGYLQVTHASSINDTFWVKAERESTTWNDVSLYQNKFSEVISRLAFEGIGLYEKTFVSTSPELSCEGSFPKCFRKLPQTGQYGSDIFIYKRSAGFGQQLEPYCEVLSSQIAKAIAPDNAVSYQLVMLHNKLASRCNLFTNEQYGYIPIHKIKSFSDTERITELLDYFRSLGGDCEQRFREMLVIDALCFNEDRHLGNFGLIVNNDTLEPVKFAPIFDMNLSLLFNASLSELRKPGDILFGKSPKIGKDFIRAGQIAVNDSIKERLSALYYFHFALQGDENFPKERISAIEGIVRETAKALLNEHQLTTIQVFPADEKINQEIREKKHAEQITKANKVKNGFYPIADTLSFQNGFLSDADDGTLMLENLSYILTVNFVKGTIRLQQQEMGFKSITMDELKTIDPLFWKDCKLLIASLKQYCEKEHFTKFSNALEK